MSTSRQTAGSSASSVRRTIRPTDRRTDASADDQPAATKGNTVYIIDMYSLIFQVFHAIPAMTSPKGQPVNAVYGFARDLQTIVKNKRPTHLVCAMDASGPNLRNELYADYKANRSEMPDDLRPQIPMIVDLAKAYGFPVVEHAGWEADDVIATLACRAAREGYDVRVVSSDKDIRQLLGPRVQIYNVRRDCFLDERTLLEEWGIRPEQVIDFQSLVGDSVDNVPGVPLVGPKKARDLLERYGTLEEVIAHADAAPGAKLRENLKNFAEQALVSRKLVTLNTDLPLELDWEAARVRPPKRGDLLAMFQDLGFRRMADEVRTIGLFPTREEDEESAVESAAVERTWTLVDTEEKFETFLNDLRAQTKFCLDLETTSIDPTRAEIVGWAFSWQPNTGYYVPVKGPDDQLKLDAKHVLVKLQPILEDPAYQVNNQNLKYEIVALRTAGIHLHGVGVDPMICDYLLDAGARTHNLERLSLRYLKRKMIPITDLIGKGKQQICMSAVDIAKCAEYATEDADVAWQLSERMEKELKSEGLWDLYWDLERPLIPVLAAMEATGIRVNADELRSQSAELTTRLEEIVKRIHAEAGKEFNIDSPLQLREVLFNQLKLPILKRTKTGPSTDQDVLERLAPIHALPRMITEHRHLSKLKGTYLDALPEMVNPATGRIHTSFSQVVAATGRLSSSDPNLQNIPIRTPEGRRIRKAFIPAEPGWKLVCADYSQIELRVLAHFSGDEALQAAFQEGIDIHTAVASDIYSVDPDKVDAEMRRVAKAVNFGVIYGQSPFGLAAALSISKDQAATFIEDYFGRYRGVERYLTGVLESCARNGYVQTILGRRRAITGVRTRAGRQRNMPERLAINTVIQGSAADLIKKAMITLHAKLPETHSQARMLLQIHDELIFEVPEEGVSALIPVVRREMETAMQFDVPIVVDVSVGDNWEETEEA